MLFLLSLSFYVFWSLEKVICVLLETHHKIKKRKKIDYFRASVSSLSKRLSVHFFWIIEPEVFCGNPGVLSLCHRMDAIMQTNVSAELRGSIYPLSNYINRSWIVTNGSWRRGGGEEGGDMTRSWRGPGCMIAFFHLISLSRFSSCPDRSLCSV